MLYLGVVVLEVYYLQAGLISYGAGDQRCRFRHDMPSVGRHISLSSTIIFCVIPLVVNVSVYAIILYKLYLVRSVRVRMVSLRAILICAIFTATWLPCLILYDIQGRSELYNVYHMTLYLNCLTDPVLYMFAGGLMRKKLNEIKKIRNRVRQTAAASKVIRSWNPQSLNMITVQNSANN